MLEIIFVGYITAKITDQNVFTKLPIFAVAEAFADFEDSLSAEMYQRIYRKQNGFRGLMTLTLREKCANAKLFLDCIFLYSD